MSIAIGVMINKKDTIKHFAQVSAVAAQLKKLAKEKKISTYMVDRRKE